MGGENAPLSAHDSAAGLIKVLDSASAATAGHFCDYTGKEIAW
jgi:hypothetical protein